MIMNSQQDTIKQLGEIALGSRLKHLSDYFVQDVTKVYQQAAVDFEPRWFTITSYLYDVGKSSIIELASALGFSHPAVIQFVNEMTKKNLIISLKDPQDKRKRIVKLTSKGKKIFESIEPLSNDIKEAVADLISESDYDIMHVIDSLEKVLNTKSLYSRISDITKNRIMKEIDIITFSDRYREDFKRLNFEWLEKYFFIEPEDEKILSHPKEIISAGGQIFFARLKDEIVGTCAAIKVNEDTFELAKMGVTENAQGKQIGKKLALAVIGFAYSQKAKSVILETNGMLYKAIKLYESLGFEYVHTKEPSKYQRTLIKMKLYLS